MADESPRARNAAMRFADAVVRISQLPCKMLPGFIDAAYLK